MDKKVKLFKCSTCNNTNPEDFKWELKSRCIKCHRERCKLNRKQARIKNPEKIKNSQKIWYNKIFAPENRLEHRLRTARVRAKRCELEFNINLEYLQQILVTQNNKCCYTDIEFDNTKGNEIYSISIDRIDSNLGYIKGNIQLVLQIINFMKQQYPEELFINMCKAVYLNSIN